MKKEWECDNPSVTCGDSSLYTREPIERRNTNEKKRLDNAVKDSSYRDKHLFNGLCSALNMWGGVMGCKNGIAAVNLERLFRESGIKKKAIAERAEYSANDISNFIHGRKVLRPNDIVRLADAFGVEPGELFKTKQN